VVPPVAVIVWEYEVPIIAFGKMVVVKESGFVTAMERALAAVCGLGWVLSLTWTVKIEVPEVLGEPERKPEVERVRPAGRFPEMTVQM
jgi:hypothetical protein